MEQYRALDLAQKPIDMVLESHAIMVEVDGRQHAQHSSGWGEEAAAQWERDRQLDRAVLSSGRRLVRLHWRDAASWEQHVMAAMRRVQQDPSSSFVYYSASYPACCRVQRP